jgi:MFS family permease
MVVTAGYTMVMPFLTIHLAVARKEPLLAVGAIWAVAGALGALAQWAAGELADRVGRRPLMLAALVLRALNLFLMGLAIERHASLATIGALTVANSMLRGLFDPVCVALVADLAPPSRRVAAYSLLRVGINLGFTAGPAVYALSARVPYPALFQAAVVTTLLATAALWATVAEPAVARAPRAFTAAGLLAFRGDPALLRFLVATLSFYLLQVQMFQTLSIYAAGALHATGAQVGTLYTLNGALVVLLQLPAMEYIQRLGTRRALVAGCIGYAISYAAVGLAVGHLTLLACIAAVTLAEIVTAPAQQTAITALAPPGRTGAYAGLYGLCMVVGQSVGPLVGTALLAWVPPRVAWFALALFGVAAALGYRAAAAALTGHKALARELKA